MAAKSQLQGVVVSDKMEQTAVVMVERQVRHAVYGKIQRRSSKFMAHNEGNAAKLGDLVEIAETRPMSRHKRWVVVKVVRRAVDLKARQAEAEVAAANPPVTEG